MTLWGAYPKSLFHVPATWTYLISKCHLGKASSCFQPIPEQYVSMTWTMALEPLIHGMITSKLPVYHQKEQSKKGQSKGTDNTCYSLKNKDNTLEYYTPKHWSRSELMTVCVNSIINNLQILKAQYKVPCIHCGCIYWASSVQCIDAHYGSIFVSYTLNKNCWLRRSKTQEIIARCAASSQFVLYPFKSLFNLINTQSYSPVKCPGYPVVKGALYVKATIHWQISCQTDKRMKRQKDIHWQRQSDTDLGRQPDG